MLTKTRIRLLQQLQSRHQRKKSEFFLCEGVRCCREAATRRPEWVEFAVVAESCADAAAVAGGWDVCTVSDAEFAGHAQTEHPQGVLLVLRRPVFEPATARIDPYVVVLDRLQTPGNVGTILRTAWAIGLRQVVYTRGTVDPLSPKCVRAGMGAQFAVETVMFEELGGVGRYYGELGYGTTWLTVVDGGVSCFGSDFELDGSLLVLGNEAGGVAELPGARRVTIPMAAGVESLNVAQAATLLMYQWVARQP